MGRGLGLCTALMWKAVGLTFVAELDSFSVLLFSGEGEYTEQHALLYNFENVEWPLNQGHAHCLLWDCASGKTLFWSISGTTEKRDFSLAVCFRNGIIYLMNNYDDVCPKVIHTALTGRCDAKAGDGTKGDSESDNGNNRCERLQMDISIFCWQKQFPDIVVPTSTCKIYKPIGL